MPTKEHVTAALGKIQRTADYDFFFENLKSPDWLEPLDELKQFDRPSEPLREGDSVRYPFWPPAKYLVKIASEKPEKVMQIILKVPATENPRVHEDFVDAALKMPPSVSVNLYKKIVQWLGSNDTNFFLLPSKVAAYIVQLRAGGFSKEALQVSDVLLGIRKFEKETDDNSFIKRADPIIRNEWDYDEALKDIAPSFHKEDKVNLIKLLCEKLRQAILFEENKDDREFRDLSYIWRGSIESSDQNHDDGLKDIIVNWIRGLSEELLIEAPELVASLCDYFRAGFFPIFSRLGLHIVRLSGRADLVSKFILDQQLFDCLDVWHEYALLIETGYPLLSNADRRKLLSMIEADVFYRNKDSAPEEINEEDNEISRYHYYYMIRQFLDGDEKKLFDRLHAKFGDLENPTFHYYMSSDWVGSSSPKSAAELKSLPTADLKKYLDDWAPPEKWGFGPTIEGLGRELQVVVVERLDEFADNMEQFQFREKTYVRAIVEGFSKALAEKKPFKWEKVIDFLLWASGQNDESEEDAFKPGGDKDPSWGWSRQAACRLVERGLLSETNEIPFSLREKVWDILSLGLSDIHPKVELEDKYTSDKGYYQTAINSIRGVALEATIHYGFWVRRNLGLSKDELPIDKAPELFSALDKHLDLRFEKSKSVRAIYGRWIPWLLPLNTKWFQAAKENILPRDKDLDGYWAAAWDANILFNQPYTKVFKELKDHYSLAIDRFEVSEGDRPEKIDERLVDHLISFFLYGEFELDSEILSKLYSKLDARLKKRALDMIGRGLANEKYEPDPNVVKRSISFWNFRVEECKKMKDPKDRAELAEFGWWFKSAQFDDEWSLDQAITVLTLCNYITPDYMVMERLLDLAEKYPQKVAEVFRLMVDCRVADYGFYGWLEKAKILLPKLLKTEARETAIKTIHKLGAYGLNQFGSLLKEVK
ncbi:hypothetical protein EZJ49_06645 [Bdellovibrio bacteriovorus]|uniref:hypothetical protein n=1 Tax=Bdellovibrio bacteriovorus TaxID=959 RepID=UPI0021D02C2E|nr:hypothetical protein [Bdellovibrio bacteriovorus]UXR65923.1 hypothetical protein EZJ49_06645 [Bdellovibrio bacteriovorus]